MLKYLFDIEILIRVALNLLSTVCWSYASASICFGYITAVWVEWNFPFTLPFTLSFPTFPIFSFFRCLCCLIFFFLGVFVFFAVFFLCTLTFSLIGVITPSHFFSQIEKSFFSPGVTSYLYLPCSVFHFLVCLHLSLGLSTSSTL